MHKCLVSGENFYEYSSAKVPIEYSTVPMHRVTNLDTQENAPPRYTAHTFYSSTLTSTSTGIDVGIAVCVQIALSVESKRTTFYSYDVRSLADMRALTPLLDWRQLLRQLFAPALPFLNPSSGTWSIEACANATAGRGLALCHLDAYFARDSFRVHINSARFLQDLNALLDEYLATPGTCTST